MTLSGINFNEIELDADEEDLKALENPKIPQKSLKLINTELPPKVEQKLDALNAIGQASNKKERAEAIKQAAISLGKSARTIRRMLAKIAHEGVATLAVGRQDKGQYRISKQWRDFIIKLYKWGQKSGSKSNISQLYVAITSLASQGEKLRMDVQRKDGIAKYLKPYPEVLEDLIALKYPSHVTVYKVINDELQRKKKFKARHPGADIDHQIVQTIDENLHITHSNQIWQADHTQLDVFIVENLKNKDSLLKPEIIRDRKGEPIRPYLTVIMDSYSGCIMGYYLGFVAADSHRVALALRNAILPKPVQEKYGLINEWVEHGIPEYLVTDRAREFKSDHMKLVSTQLDFKWKLRAFPSAGGLVETIFNQTNNEVLKNLPGYTGSKVDERPKNAENHACMTFEELEKELVQYFVDHYNQHQYPKMKIEPQFEVLTRSKRWQSGLISGATIIDERTLDICLLKQAHRRVQKLGTIQFENLIYIGDCLRDFIGEEISLRYDPRNIVTLLAYTSSNQEEPSEFIGVIKARHFEHEQMTFDELRWIVQKLKRQWKNADNISILNERYNHLNFIEQKRVKKRQKRKKAQQKRDETTNESKIVEIFPQNALEPDDKTVIEEATEANTMGQKRRLSKIHQSSLPESHPRVKRRRSGIAVHVQDWNEYKKNNW
ncbi:Mu transposase C-terminal domain-containing protein [Gloeothece verrucosa]|uniref:Transposase-like Mu n=1 Tax=Gloeothece verrucosa (strain PCC 7822) TaxID=497965 RepID=E0UMY1_GLOV7|nr:Mu transposase C-terminal domain-containing protein [Gloeothece verrucosa]ADN18311.1 Transposase-like Mu [Gloeothece verrucosa PCC 7822]